MSQEFIATRRPEFVKERLIQINNAAADLYLENGLLLREYKENGYYKAHGYASFDEAVETMKQQGLLEYGARQARHFIDIVNMTEKLQLGSADIKDIGMSKLREIASVRNEDQQRRLLAEAPDKPFSEIQREAKQARDKIAGRESDPFMPIILKNTTQSQHEFFMTCMREARNLYRLPDDMTDGVILTDVILTAWFNSREAIEAEERAVNL